MPGGNGCQVANGRPICPIGPPSGPPTMVPWMPLNGGAATCGCEGNGNGGGTQTGRVNYCGNLSGSPLPCAQAPTYAPSGSEARFQPACIPI